MLFQILVTWMIDTIYLFLVDLLGGIKERFFIYLFIKQISKCTFSIRIKKIIDLMYEYNFISNHCFVLIN